MQLPKLSGEYWEQRHVSGDTPWDIGGPSPALRKFYDTIEDRSLRVLIPGAGHAHEAKSLLELGFTNITVCDISSTAMIQLQVLLPADGRVTFYTGDFFTMEGQFDLIVEQTFFCALDPSYREAYVTKMADLLSENGMLAGLLFATQFAKEGPPFGGSIEEYRDLFTCKLHILKMKMCSDSIPQRLGNEVFFVCKKSKSW
jgi:hypothetical protein